MTRTILFGISIATLSLMTGCQTSPAPDSAGGVISTASGGSAGLQGAGGVAGRDGTQNTTAAGGVGAEAGARMGGSTGSGGSLALGGTATTGGRSTSGGADGGGAGAGGRTGGSSASGGATGGSAGAGGSEGGRSCAGCTASGGIGNGGAVDTGGRLGTGGGAGKPADGGGSATGTHYYVSPEGAGTDCSSTAPCSITQAQALVRTAAKSMQSDIVVELADGTHRLKTPWVFTADDSGTGGHTITWQSASGAKPVISGAQPITGWSLSDSGKGIWKATAPATFVTRQLYVDGTIATRARLQFSIGDISATKDGFTFSSNSLTLLNTVAHPERVDLHSVNSFTDRYSPVKSISSGSATMVQPAWEQNTWGYDYIKSPFRQGPAYMENAYELIDQGGEWYQDTTAGILYYKPLPGQDMSKADVELPGLEVLVSIGGSYDQPVHDLAFQGLTFSHTSWLGPSGSDGYANQQTGAFISGPKSQYPEFEATRPAWHQMPAAVQVSAAKNISFVRDRFAALGQVGLGIGNDDNAHLSKVGLGADTINVVGCVFSQIAGGAIVVGGIQAKAHHPGGDVALSALTAGQQRMIDQNITIKDNLIHDVGIDYRDFAGVMYTYAQNVLVSHNEVYNLPYSGINTGYGWGTNDAGGNADYKTRAQGNLYKYQPLYTNPTIAKNNQVVANYVHHAMLQMNDGGCHYNLSATGTTCTQNYCNGSGSGLSGTYFGYYADEGSAYLTISKNVFASFGAVATANANASNNTGHNTFTNNWVSSSNPNPSLGGPGNTVSGNISITGTQISGFPTDAQAVANAAGLEAAYADLKSNP
jgi:hypothetical protein